MWPCTIIWESPCQITSLSHVPVFWCHSSMIWWLFIWIMDSVKGLSSSKRWEKRWFWGWWWTKWYIILLCIKETINKTKIVKHIRKLKLSNYQQTGMKYSCKASHNTKKKKPNEGLMNQQISRQDKQFLPQPPKVT